MTDVLLIEDDQWQADLLIEAFKAADIRVAVARNALEGMEMIDQVKPQAIVLDFFLPGPNGLTFLHELRSYSDTAHLPVVIFSTVSTIKDQLLEPYGIAGVLDKSQSTASDVVHVVKRLMK